MIEPMSLRPRWAIAAALIAVVFGTVTIIVGGKTLLAGQKKEPPPATSCPSFFGSTSSLALHTLSRVLGCIYGSVGQPNCRRR